MSGTTERAPRVVFHFGALAPPLTEQCAEHGYTLAHAPLLQRLAEAITLASIHGVLSDAEKHRARQRLTKLIARNATPATP